MKEGFILEEDEVSVMRVRHHHSNFVSLFKDVGFGGMAEHEERHDIDG